MNLKFWGGNPKKTNTEAELRSTLATADRDSWIYQAMTEGKSGSGVTITEDSIMKSSVFLAATKVIAEGIAQLPLNLYKRGDDGSRQLMASHSLHFILHSEPNNMMSSFTYRETVINHVMRWGNSYSLIKRTGNRVTALQLLQPDCITPALTSNGSIVYIHKANEVEIARYDASEILHIKSLSDDGLVGISPLEMAAKEVIGLSLACEQFAASYFGNGCKVGGVLSHPGKLEDTPRENIKKAWKSAHQGADKANDIAVLSGGLTYSSIAESPEASQLIAVREFQIAEVARIFKIPPHLLGDLSKATFSNIEQQSLEFATQCLTPWLNRIEGEYNRVLLTSSEKKTLFVEHNLDGMLRGDVSTRYNSYTAGRNGGWLSINDIRKYENLPAIDGGDVYLQPLNMADVSAEPAEIEGDTDEE